VYAATILERAPAGTTSDAFRTAFAHDGFVGPVELLSRATRRRVCRYLRLGGLPTPAVWEKGRGVREELLYELATDDAILERVAALLGEDIILWGVSAVRRAPGQAHPWHTDIESSTPTGGFVSVWIGLERTCRASLQLISGSHRLGRSVQEVRAELGLAREEATPEALLRVARGTDPEARLVVPDMKDGDALFFDGRLWHGTENRRASGDRIALLLQYAAADRAVRIPDWDQLDWPFSLLTERLPPVIPVRGTPRRDRNRIASPPPPGRKASSRVGALIHTFDLPVGSGAPSHPWQPFHAFAGATGSGAEITCHASVLAGGHSPHPVHAHAEEELLIALNGEAELVVPSGPSDQAPRTERLRPGSFVYYPAWQPHTISNPGSEPIAYLMFKWRAPWIDMVDALDTRVEHVDVLSPPEEAPALWSRLLFEGPTDYLDKLHAHLTVLQPGAGYEPHRDEHDVAIATLEGSVETLGRRVGPGSVVFYGAGERHGMRNVAQAPARYLVFELHRPRTTRVGRRSLRARRLVARSLRRARARRP
jgi:mannose-6-phosphate isomerase-like protein (cupin superfamily)